jgi:hypothetical protein
MSIPTDEHQKRVAELQELLAKAEESDEARNPPQLTAPVGYFGHPPPSWRYPS